MRRGGGKTPRRIFYEKYGRRGVYTGERTFCIGNEKYIEKLSWRPRPEICGFHSV